MHGKCYLKKKPGRKRIKNFQMSSIITTMSQKPPLYWSKLYGLNYMLVLFNAFFFNL